MSPSDQTTASQMLEPAGVPMKSARTASTIAVMGLCSAMGCSQLGIDSTGTKAEETKVSGKMMVKPHAFAASGDDETSPMNAKTQEKA